MAPFRTFAMLLLGFLLASTAGSEVPSNDAPEGVKMKSFDEIKNESELYSLIIEKNFSKALERVNRVPAEAKILIKVLGGSKNQEVVKTALPLHFAFEVDIPENLPSTKRLGGMKQAQVDLIAALIKANPLATAQEDKFGRLPLHLALISPNPPPAKIVSAMLKLYPESAKIQGLQDLTPLHMAVAYPMTTLENVEAVLVAFLGATEVEDEDGSLPIHSAAWGGDLPDAKEVMKLLLEQNPAHLSIPDGDGETLLTLMTMYGRTSEEAVRFILDQDHKAVYRYRDEQEGSTILHLAVTSSFEQNNTVYKPFTEMHTDLLKKCNRIGQLPLHALLQRCCATSEMVLDLIEGYPQAVSTPDGHGLLPLHHACNAGVNDLNIVKKLLEISPQSAKVEVNLSDGSKGPLPIHLALSNVATHGHAFEVSNRVIEMLLNAYPEAANIWNPESALLPLHAAFLSKRSASVLLKLMRATTDGISTEVYIQESGERKTTTLLHLFAAQSHTHMEPDDINEIIKAFALSSPEIFSAKDSDGRLPLHMVWMQLETKEESRRALVEGLVTRYPNAVHVADKSNMTPLAYITRARDLYSFEKVFEMNPFAAAVKSDDGMYPLHQACTSGATGRLSQSVDKILTALLQKNPEAAAEPDDSGSLPLHLFCKTAGASHAEPHTIQRLVDAYPDALNITDQNSMLPLQLVAISAVDSEEESDHEYWADFVEVLVDEFPSAVGTVEKGDPALAAILSKMETLSVHRRRDEDHLIRVVKRLYAVYPDAVKEGTTKKRTGLHSLLVLVGDMGAMTPHGWSDITLQAVLDYPELLKVKDSHQRTPLHLFCLYLGDTALGLRDNQDPRTRSRVTSEMERLFLALIKGYPEALDETDEYGYTPQDLASHDRLRYSKGGRRFYRSEIVNMMKRYLRRGSDYWKMKVAIESSPNCTAVAAALSEASEKLVAKLNEFEVEPSNLSNDYECGSQSIDLCKACPREVKLLGRVENNLATYAEFMEERSKDANEISGEYLIDY
jgi:ankyrin repeat protein